MSLKQTKNQHLPLVVNIIFFPSVIVLMLIDCARLYKNLPKVFAKS